MLIMLPSLPSQHIRVVSCYSILSCLTCHPTSLMLSYRCFPVNLRVDAILFYRISPLNLAITS